jgi:hypothetical protein
MNEGRNNDLTGPMQRVEARLGRPLREYLAEQYAVKTLAEIGEELGVGESAVSRWMDRLGLERRFPGQRPTVTA